MCRHPAQWIVPEAYEGHILEGHAWLPAVKIPSPPPSKKRRIDNDSRCADPQVAAVPEVQVEAVLCTCCSSLKLAEGCAHMYKNWNDAQWHMVSIGSGSCSLEDAGVLQAGQRHWWPAVDSSWEDSHCASKAALGTGASLGRLVQESAVAGPHMQLMPVYAGGRAVTSGLAGCRDGGLVLPHRPNLRPLRACPAAEESSATPLQPSMVSV